MMWGYDYSWSGLILMTFCMAFWIALLVVLSWLTIRWLSMKSLFNQSQRDTPVAGPSALEILQQRYARGEIDTTTFEQMRERLGSSEEYRQSLSKAH